MVIGNKEKMAGVTSRPFSKFGLTGVFAAAIFGGAFASSIEGKADSFVRAQLEQNKKKGWTSVILKLSGDLTPKQSAKFCELDADLYRRLKFVQSVAVRVPNRNLSKLVALPFVERVSLDASVRKYDNNTVGRTGADVAFADYNLTGRGVTVAVLDSGIDNHEDLADPTTGRSRVIASVSFAPGGGTADLNGHGTHVAGILAGNGASSTGRNYTRSFYGVARKANLVNVRVLDALGRTNVSSVLSAMQWVMNNRSKYNIRVMNMSIGHSVGESYKTDPLCIAVEKAWKAGIVVVVAAGNDGRQIDSPIPLPGKDNGGYGTNYGSIVSPANSPFAITVGAMRQMDGDRNHDTIATYSSRGPSRIDYVVKPDIVAPGNRIISLRKPLSIAELTGPFNIVPVRSYQKNPSLLASSDYFELSGTSMAAPVVAGAAALLIEAYPNITPDTVKMRLMSTADRWKNPNGETDALTYGAGYLNIPAALQSTRVATTWAESPFMTDNGAGDLVMSDEGLLKGSNLLGNLLGSDTVWATNKAGSKPTSRAMWGIDDFQINLGIVTLFGD